MKEIAQSSKILGEVACFLNFLVGGWQKISIGAYNVGPLLNETKCHLVSFGLVMN